MGNISSDLSIPSATTFILFSKLGFNDDLIEAEKRGEVILFSLN